MKRRFPATITFLFLVVTAARAQTTVTMNPVADAFVTNGPGGSLAGSNYGAAGALAISGATATRTGVGPRGTFDSVIRFDFASAKASFDATYGVGLWAAKSITLRLTTTSANNAIFNNNATGQFSVLWMQNDAWTPGVGTPNAPGDTGITYDSLPGFLGAGDQSVGVFSFNSATSGADGANTTYTLTLGGGLLSDLTDGGLASFELAAVTGTMSYLFNSADFSMGDGRRPLMSITAIAVPEPAVGLLLGLGGGFLFWGRSYLRRNGRAIRP